MIPLIVLINDDFFSVKFTTSDLGGFAITNAPDLNTTSVYVHQIEGLSVYPNPVRDFIQIRGGQTSICLKYQVFSVNGTIISKGVVNREIDSSDWVIGNYFLHVYDGNRRNIYKIIKV